jgi:DNA-binding NarL/FixJ family response regulator
MTKKQKILIVDDHELFREGIKTIINRFEFAKVVGEATNGKEMLEIIDKCSPDIVLMDIKMPEMNGIEATEQLKQKHPGIYVVALSLYGDEAYLESMLEKGVSGFILKNTDSDNLERALKLISNGKNYFSEELIPYFTKKYIGGDQESDHAGLTKREVEVLKLIGEGYSNKEIAEKLFISLRTVKNHRANLNMKTGSKNTAGLLAYAIKHNILSI